MDDSISSDSASEKTVPKNEYVFLYENPLHKNVGDLLGDDGAKETKVHLAIYSLSPEQSYRLPNPTPKKINTYTHESSTPCLKYLVRNNDDQKMYEFPSFSFQVSADDKEDQINHRFREECFLKLFEFLQLNVCEYSSTINQSEASIGSTNEMHGTDSIISPMVEPDQTQGVRLTKDSLSKPLNEFGSTPVLIPESVPTPDTGTAPTTESTTAPTTESTTAPVPISETTATAPVPISETTATALTTESTTAPTTESESVANGSEQPPPKPAQMGGTQPETCDQTQEINHIFAKTTEFIDSIYQGIIVSKDKSNMIVLLNYDALFRYVDSSKTKLTNKSTEPSSLTFLKPILPDMYPISDDNLTNKDIRWGIVHELIYQTQILGVPVDPTIEEIFWANKIAFQIHYLYYDKLIPNNIEDIISMGISVSPETLEKVKNTEGEILKRRDRIVDFPFCVYLVTDDFTNELVPETTEESDRRIQSAKIPIQLYNYKYVEQYGDRYCFSLVTVSDDPNIVSRLKRYAILEYEEKYVDKHIDKQTETNGWSLFGGADIKDESTDSDPSQDQPSPYKNTELSLDTNPNVESPIETTSNPESLDIESVSNPVAEKDEEHEFSQMSVPTIYFVQKIGEKDVPIWGILSMGQCVPL